ncbi:MAG: BamA/TamA family outer membrane protein [Ignavibacteriaceae bacterium]
MHLGFKTFFCLLIFICPFYAQQIKLPPEFILEKRVVIPGEEYKAGTFYEFFFGAHWRKLWITPIEVPVINLDKFAGGITPVKRGGGTQTKSVRFENKLGIQYKFRSIDKDPKQNLPEELQETVAADILKDQISSANPVAALIVVPILNAVNILQAEPILCILPDDPKLGKFREEFGNMLGMMEIHPDVDEDDNVTFEGAEKVEGTFDLLDRLEKDTDEFIASSEYLKARLIDMFLGDWDRHTDQWRWAMFKENNKKIWYPIPRDRDQAFSKYDGLFPWITALSIPQIESFSDTYPEIEDLTWSGRHLDRRFLVYLNKEQWDSVTNFVVKRLTDSLIEYSVQRLPKEMYSAAGEELITTLKARRNHLAEASECFFRNTLKYVDIKGSSKDDYAEINRTDNNVVEIKLYNRDKNSGEKKGQPFFNSVFYSEYTKEIRIELYDGDDKAVVTGNVDSSIPVYIAGDEGKDELIDSAEVKGSLLNFLPLISLAETQTHFFDKGKKTTFISGPRTRIRDKELPEPRDEFEKYEPQLRTWGHDWKFAPWFGANPDDGIFIGGGPVLYEHGFRTNPYVYRMELAAGYASFLDAGRIRYFGEFNSIFDNNKMTFEARFSELEIIHFYGLGNNTERIEGLDDTDFYKAKQHQLLVTPEIEFPLDKNLNLYFGYRFLFSEMDLEEGTLIFSQRPYGSHNMILNSFLMRFVYDSRDDEIIPQNGFLFSGLASFYPSFKKDLNSFSKIKGSFSSYIPLFSLPYSTLALKAAGEKNWGRYPFFESAFLGGLETLRGFDRNRFAGDASISGSAEIRLLLSRFKFIVPIYLGTALFTDAGRVFYSKESSNTFHKSVGVGLWFSFIYPELLLSTYAVISDDDEAFYLTTGFAF